MSLQASIVFRDTDDQMILDDSIDTFAMCFSDIVTECSTSTDAGFMNSWLRAKNVWLHIEGEKAQKLSNILSGDSIDLIALTTERDSGDWNHYFVDREMIEVKRYDEDNESDTKLNKLQLHIADKNVIDVFIGRQAVEKQKKYWTEREGF